jgi:hypothetical protein
MWPATVHEDLLHGDPNANSGNSIAVPLLQKLTGWNPTGKS